MRDIEKEEENRFEVHFPFHYKPQYPKNSKLYHMNATAREVTKDLPDQFINHAPQYAYRLLKDPQMMETKDSAAERLNQTMSKLITEKIRQKTEFQFQIENFQQ